MRPDTAALLDLDIDQILRDAVEHYSRVAPAEQARHRAAVGRARLDAARFLLRRGDAEDRRLAARHAFGLTGRAA